ncbi:MAG TPA: hypothetical protein PKN75_08080 [Bacteroidia bacterium]|nr:hypothetical protein [Bacteroidia bacterium]HNU33535.1 hypothetical protein [Bacteroidia bacterium]
MIKKKKKVNSGNLVNEPDAVYNTMQNKELNFFSTFEEMNNADLIQMANSTPMQRLQNITYTIMHLYKKELQKPQSKTLTFDT